MQASPPRQSGDGPARGAIYLRISDDKRGDSAGVERQRVECLALAERLGIRNPTIYVDNDISATSGAVRPEFERLLTARPSIIITWHQDRLLRLTRDLERVIALNVPIHTVSAGTLDLTTPTGRAVARTVAAWSQFEGEQKAARQRSKNRQQVESGLPLRGVRPFGFEVDGMTPRESEAILVREAYATIVDGGTLYSIQRRLNDADVLTTRGNRWSYATIASLLRRPRNVGRLVHHGEVIREDLPALIDVSTFETALVILKDPSRNTAPGPKVSRHLMAGLAVCGVCGSPMRSAATKDRRGQRVAYYKCGTKARGDGLGERHATIRTEELELLVAGGVFDALLYLSKSGALPDSVDSPAPLLARKAALVEQRSRAQDLALFPGADVTRLMTQVKEFSATIESLDLEVLERSRSRATVAAMDIVRSITIASGMVMDELRVPTIEETTAQVDLYAAFYRQFAALSFDEKRELVRATLRTRVNPAGSVQKSAVRPATRGGTFPLVDIVTVREGGQRVDFSTIAL